MHLSGPDTAAAAAAYNRELHDEFWRERPDFTRHHPGARHRRRLLVQKLGERSFSTLLDVGSGDGTLLEAITARFPTAALTGADVSSVAVAEQRRRLPRLRFHQLDIEHAALAERFDVVVCSEVIEHLAEPARAVGHLARMVAPGGRLLVTCPTGKVHATERHFGHLAHPEPDALEALLKGAGLVPRSLEVWGFPAFVALKYATNLDPAWSLAKFGVPRYAPWSKAVAGLLYWLNFANLGHSRWGCQIIAVAEQRA